MAQRILANNLFGTTVIEKRGEILRQSEVKNPFLGLQPIPYQGSKRKAANKIFEFAPTKVNTLYEPFAGSAAITLFAANKNLADRYVINDSYEPLANLLKLIIGKPDEVSREYGKIWQQQLNNPKEHYYKIREQFNKDGNPIKFLFLMAKCVKNAVRFNGSGQFNQSPDKRRLGRSPKTMRKHLLYTSFILKGKVTVYSKDYSEVIAEAGPKDLVYMDPPYQGTSTNKNPRYHQGVDLKKLVNELNKLNRKNVPYLLSFDGQLGDRKYGEALPNHLELARIDINMGRSAQSTLNGGDSISIESLYISPNLVLLR